MPFHHNYIIQIFKYDSSRFRLQLGMAQSRFASGGLEPKTRSPFDPIPTLYSLNLKYPNPTQTKINLLISFKEINNINIISKISNHILHQYMCLSHF